MYVWIHSIILHDSMDDNKNYILLVRHLVILRSALLCRNGMDIYLGASGGCRSWKPHQNLEPMDLTSSISRNNAQMDSKNAGIGATGKGDPKKTCRLGDLRKKMS